MSLPQNSAPLRIGHRGAPGYRPEHTASSYRFAFAQGVDAIEPDLVVSRDGVLVIRHENEISGTTDVAERPEFASRCTTKVIDGVTLTGWFTEDFSWEELSTLRCRERIPTIRPENTRFNNTESILRLEELLHLVDEASSAHGRPINVVIELKHVHALTEQGHDLVTLTLDALDRAGWGNRPERIIFECFELGPLQRLRAAHTRSALIFLMESTGAPADEIALHGNAARPYEWYRSDAGLDYLRGHVDGISLAKRDLLRVNPRGKALGTTDIVARAHAKGLLVYTWTLRPENAFLTPGFRTSTQRAEHGKWQEEWQLILSTGLDGVFLDHPDLFQKLPSQAR